MFRQIFIIGPALAAIAACSSPTSGDPPQRDVSFGIVFSQYAKSDAFAQLSFLDPNTGEVIALAIEPGAFEDLSSSPDGSRLLFTRTAGEPAIGTYQANANGSGVRALPAVGFGYVWSPEGERIASLIPGDHEPYGPPPTQVVRISDSAGSKLTDHPDVGAYYFRPSWSPDGSRLVYHRDIPFDGEHADLFVAEVDGSEITNVSQTPGYEGEVAWSPDGSVIAFTAVRGDTSGVFSMRPDGSGVQPLYTGAVIVHVRWAPDGSALLFLTPGATEPEYRLMVLESDGSSRVIATGVIEGHSPSWAPDGSWITYARYVAGEYDIHIVRPDGSDDRAVTPDGVHGRSPVWVTLP